MKFIYLLVLLVLPGFQSFSFTPDQPIETEVASITTAEAHLAKIINEYRKSRHLPSIPLSSSLCKVARYHVNDLAAHFKEGNSCNLHSWSQDPRWSSCCYTPDHKQAACMWDKPRELTNYNGDGYEIAYFSNFEYSSDVAFADDALKGWKSSKGHNEIIINTGKWKTADWKAMGVAINNDYTVVWFGEITDKAGKPKICEY